MKHCAKKLLGLAFALALCLAVGGTALAQTPEQEVLAYEQNVTTEPGTNTIDKLATEGYQVTIPTTVTVKSGEDKETLMVTADVRQLRTLTITLDSTNSWQLKHESGQVQAGYSLTSEGGGYTDGGNMWYQDEDTTGGKKKLKLHLSVGQKAQGDFDVNWKDRFTIPLTVAVDPSQATMSGTYSDTVSFAFAFTHKSCVTYFINVYEQELQLTNSGAHVQAVNMVNADGTVKPDAKPVRTEIWEYPVGNDVDHEWSYGGNESDAELRWEKATATMNTARDEAAGKLDANKNVTINLNLVRKRYWLDVNGATDYTNEYADGNQGNKIAGFVNMQVSVDNGTTWSDWFWQEPGDDYWGQFPYGIRFRLGLHHVKNGYVYEMVGNGARIIANKKDTVTKPGEKEGATTYYVYEDTLTGEPTGTDSRNNVRYCYIPCYKKGLTYMANEGTGGKEDVNGANKPRTNVLYQEGYALESPEDLDIHAPSADMEFAGWSTKSTYTTGDTLYQVGETVAPGAWENYTDQTDLDKRPQLNGARDTQKRELYAIWGYKTTIKIAFENQWGSTDKDATGVFKDVKKGGFNNEQTLKTDAIVIPGQTLTLDLNDSDVKAAITAATKAVNTATNDIATDDKIWDLEKEYTITVPQNKAATLRFEILRKRYLLNVMAVLSDGGVMVKPLVNAEEAATYGKFHVKSNGSCQTAGNPPKASVYQWLRNYGGSYEVYGVEAKPGYQFFSFVVTAAGGSPTTDGDGTHITGTLTGKNENLGYFGGNATTYTGDTIYVVFKEDVVTFDFNGGKNQEGETKTEVQYDPDSFIPVMYLRKDGSTSSPIGWSLNKEETQGEVIYHSRDTQLKDIPWPNPENKVLYARWSSGTTGSTTPAAGPSLAPAAKKVLTVHYHANFDPMEELALDLDPDPLLEDMDDDFGFAPDPLPEDVLDPTVEAVKIVTYKPDENVVLRPCMFKRGGYVFVGWNTEPDGTGKKYEVNGVPITDWAAGTTVDLYAQWKKPEHLKPVVDSEPFVPADPDTPPERIDDGFDADFGADPDPLPEGMDDAFGVDPAAQPEELDDAFGVDPDPLPEALDDAFGV